MTRWFPILRIRNITPGASIRKLGDILLTTQPPLLALMRGGDKTTTLARIIHELSAATPDTLADTALRSVGRLDVWSYTPAAASVARIVSAASTPFRDDNS
jgi:hypothetical protein